MNPEDDFGQRLQKNTAAVFLFPGALMTGVYIILAGLEQTITRFLKNLVQTVAFLVVALNQSSVGCNTVNKKCRLFCIFSKNLCDLLPFFTYGLCSFLSANMFLTKEEKVKIKGRSEK